MLIELLHSLLSRTKWEIIYSTQDLQKYASVKGKLMNHSIPVKTETINPHGRFSGRGGHGHFSPYGTVVTYNILVKAEDIHKANEVIHQS